MDCRGPAGGREEVAEGEATKIYLEMETLRAAPSGLHGQSDEEWKESSLGCREDTTDSWANISLFWICEIISENKINK